LIKKKLYDFHGEDLLIKVGSIDALLKEHTTH